jgi:hypothetical protein
MRRLADAWLVTGLVTGSATGLAGLVESSRRFFVSHRFDRCP